MSRSLFSTQSNGDLSFYFTSLPFLVLIDAMGPWISCCICLRCCCCCCENFPQFGKFYRSFLFYKFDVVGSAVVYGASSGVFTDLVVIGAVLLVETLLAIVSHSNYIKPEHVYTFAFICILLHFSACDRSNIDIVFHLQRLQVNLCLKF